jgi:hypothetical protein
VLQEHPNLGARDAMAVAATATDKELLLRGFAPSQKGKAGRLPEIVVERATLAVRQDEEDTATLAVEQTVVREIVRESHREPDGG